MNKKRSFKYNEDDGNLDCEGVDSLDNYTSAAAAGNVASEVVVVIELCDH